MDFLTRFGLQKSRLTVLVMIGLLLQGLLLYSSFPKRDNPAITIRTAVVSADYPGMAPERIESLIAMPLERKIREIGKVKDIQTLITTGSVSINVNLKENFPSSELPEIFQKLRNKVAELDGELPQGTIGPSVNSNFGDVAIATIAITGEGFSYAELEETGKALQRALYKVKGLSKIELLGTQQEKIWLEVDTRNLASTGSQLDRIIADLRAQNIILPAGSMNADGTTILLEASGLLNSVDDIKKVLTKVKGVGGFTRLEDLFTVRRGYTEPMEAPAYFNGRPALVAAVQMQDGNDIQTVSARLDEAVQAFRVHQPIGIELSYATFQANKVTAAINGALINVGQTIGVVLVVMLLFLGLRSGIVIAMIVPFAATFSLILMGPIGIELEQISIAAVIISLGLLVDNGLVIVEDIQGQINKGVAPRDAALASGKQFMIPLMVASITTVSAFIPMMVLEGSSGDYAFSLGAVVALMLVGSWLTAMYILPLLCTWLIRPKAAKAEDAAVGPFQRFLGLYGTITRKLLPLAPIVLIVAYGIVIGASSFFSSVRQEQFPLAASPQFLIYMDMQKGTALTETQARALEVSSWLMDKEANPEILNNILYVGSGGPRFDLGLNPADDNPASAFFLVNTDSFEGALRSIARADRYLALNHPEARFKVKRLSMGAAESGIVEVKVKGPHADRLMQLSREIETIFATAPGIAQNENDWGNKVLKVVADINQDKARDLGLSSKAISESLSMLFTGTPISVYREGDKSIPMIVRAGKDFRSSLDDLSNVTLGVDNRLVALDELAILRPYLEYSQIRREDQVRTIKISGKSPELTAGEMLAFISPSLDKLDLSGGYSIEIGGELKEAAETNEQLAAGGPLALMVMLAAIMFQFNSFRRSLLVFSTIPLVVIGVPFALILTDKPLSFFGILGFISLAGIIINNAIVLIDQIDIERQSKALSDAIVAASEKRLRPIMLTSLTTIAGLTPMALTGGEMWSPMAMVMIGGLALSSLLSLFFVPAGYHLLFRWGQKSRPVAAEH